MTAGMINEPTTVVVLSDRDPAVVDVTPMKALPAGAGIDLEMGLVGAAGPLSAKMDSSDCAPSSEECNRVDPITLADDDSESSISVESVDFNAEECSFACSKQRSVRFAPAIVTEVRERPRTLPEEKPILFYSGLEIQNFRTEYRMIVRQRAAAKMRERTQQSSTLMPLAGLIRVAATFLHETAVTSSQASQRALTTWSAAGATQPGETSVLVDTLYLF